MPATNGRRISRNSHIASAAATTAKTQNSIWRAGIERPPAPASRNITSSLGRPVGTHVAHPFAEIRADRKQRQGGDDRHRNREYEFVLDTKTERCQHETRKCDL